MRNEVLLIASMVLLYGAVLVGYRLFGRAGLYAFTVFATITANIEVMMLVDAFGMEMTLGNVLFATTFLITDILSETEGRKAAQKAVYLGIATSILFVAVSQSWLLFQVSANDRVFSAFVQIFSNTPRLVLASLLVYALAQPFDVWLYHFWWSLTKRKFGDGRRFLWLRNNFSTLISQMLNVVLFTLLAFWGTYDFSTVVSIFASSYAVFIVTSLADTPIIYLARHMHERKQGGRRSEDVQE